MDDPQHVATPGAPRRPAAHGRTRESCRAEVPLPHGWTSALRGWTVALAIAAVVGHETASADDGPPPFPATVRVLADHTYLRAGPGPDYYPTERLAQGESVEIWAVDESGFCAVRPVTGSFSWVRASDLRLDDRPLGAVAPPGSEGVVIHDGALARIGSQLNDLRHVAQVSLEAGERVRVLGRVSVAAGRHAGDWVKIAPPAGEFRFAARSDLESPPGMAPATVPAAPAAAAALAEMEDRIGDVAAQALASLEAAHEAFIEANEARSMGQKLFFNSVGNQFISEAAEWADRANTATSEIVGAARLIGQSYYQTHESVREAGLLPNVLNNGRDLGGGIGTGGGTVPGGQGGHGGGGGGSPR